jgi:antitoxin component YwqK of YwqJK toxin-antitoxin module
MQYSIVVFSFLLIASLNINSEKMYQKIYYDNDTIKAEGWVQNDLKNGYWKFYHVNGNLKKEGHFLNGKELKYWYFYRENGKKEKEGHFVKGIKNKWWLFYDAMEFINHKCQLKNNQKNGYCLMY